MLVKLKLNYLFEFRDEQKICFIDAPGGTGKTFLFNTIMSKYRSEKLICLGSASSGISSILLEGGKTVHSRFKIPLKLINKFKINIRKISIYQLYKYNKNAKN